MTISIPYFSLSYKDISDKNPEFDKKEGLWYWTSSYTDADGSKQDIINSIFYKEIPCLPPVTLCVKEDSSSLRKYFKTKLHAKKAYEKAFLKVLKIVMRLYR